MKRPTWATVVGIIGIIFSCLGILGAGQDIMMPKILEFQKEIFSVMKEQIEKDTNEREGEKESQAYSDEKVPAPEVPPEMLDMMEKMWNFPEWFGAWAVFSGILKLIISGFYLLASIFLLQTKPSSIPLFYCAAVSSIAFGVARGIVALSALSFMGVAMMFGGVFGIVIDIVLIIVVALGDKEAFSPKSPQTAGV